MIDWQNKGLAQQTDCKRMSQDPVVLGSYDRQDSVLEERSQASFALVSDIDTDIEIGYSSHHSRKSREEGETQRDSAKKSALDEDEFLEIFGLPKTSFRSTASDTQLTTTTRKDSTTNSLHEPLAGNSQTEKDEVIEIFDDPLEPSDQEAASQRLNVLGSELICIDDDEEEEAGDVYLCSSPSTQINDPIDLVNITDNEEHEPVVVVEVEEQGEQEYGDLNSRSNTSTTIDDSLSAIMNAGSVPLPFPFESPRRGRTSSAGERANIGPFSSPILECRSSSIGRHSKSTNKANNTPQQKKKPSGTAKITKPSPENSPKVMQNMRNSFLNIQNKNKITSSAKDLRFGRTTNVFNMERTKRTLSSEISEFSSNLNEVEYNNEKLLTDEEINEKRKNLKYLKRKESTRVKNLISDLADVRNKRPEEPSKYSKSVENVINTVKNAASIQMSDTSEISNSSTLIKESTISFMDNVTDDIDLYTEERLELMLERSKQLEPEKLKKVNQFKHTKAELTEKITCCFTNTLHEKLEAMDKEYYLLVKPAKFEVIEELLPIIRFKRYVDSVLFKKKNTFIPIKSRHLFENFTILLYDSKDLIELFKRGIMKRQLNSIKSKYPGTKIAVWVLGYEQYLQSLKAKANRAYKEKVQRRLNPTANETSKKKKNTENIEDMVQPSHVKQKLLKYEVEHEFTFQSFKGLKDMLEWLKSIAYTLSSKYTDSFQRNGEISNIGKVKSGETPKDCMAMMLSQIKGMTESRAKKFVYEGSYTSIGDLFDEIVAGKSLTQSKVLRTDHERLIKKVLLSRNENDLL